MTEQVDHTDVAAYALGVLAEHDRSAFEAHLAQCTLCTEHLDDFTGVAGLLVAVAGMEPDPASEEPTGEQQVARLLRRRQAAERSRRRGTAALGAAAAVVLLAAGTVVGGMVTARTGIVAGPRERSSAPRLLDNAETRSAADPVTGVAGTVAMQRKGWGTNIALELGHLKGPLVCRLVAVSTAGERHVVVDWRVPPKGYGVPGSPDRLLVNGGTSLDRADIARFDVQVGTSGRTLLRIPV
jgi:hypothetical protein